MRNFPAPVPRRAPLPATARPLSEAMHPPPKIAVVVHGRFHAFDLARELLRLGHDVHLFTNYPACITADFGIPRARTRSYLAHGVLGRLAMRLAPAAWMGAVERCANTAFGRWAARQVPRERWDAVIAFSGVAEDVFRALEGRPTLKVLHRGSSHIAVQRRILEGEAARTGRPVARPSDWIVARETREYGLADMIHVLSGFAEASFVEQGVDPEKVYRLNLGVDVARFRAPPEVVRRRCERVLAGEPLRVLNVGPFSCRKGAWDWAAVLDELAGPRFHFRFVGPVAADAAGVADRLSGLGDFRGKVPQNRLPGEYAWGDLFLLPTLEDGFAAVLPQALAGGLPLLTTPNCGGPDLTREGETGWVVPVRAPGAIVERLRWLDGHRQALARAVREAYAEGVELDWSETAYCAVRNILNAMAAKRNRQLVERIA